MNEIVPAAGQIILLQFNPQVGHEQAGERPALVLSERLFQKESEFMFVCPVTSQVKNRPFEVEVKHPSATGVALVDQTRSVDWRKRIIRVVDGKIPEQDLLHARQLLARILGINFVD